MIFIKYYILNITFNSKLNWLSKDINDNITQINLKGTKVLTKKVKKLPKISEKCKKK